jgi:hypothetical protein
VRVRQFELRLLAGVLAVAWALFAGLVLVLYRPGGPADAAVVVVAALPTVVALAALTWPPVAGSTRAFAAIAWLGVAVALVLIPSIGGLLTQLQAGGTQTLLPSPEAAYPYLLALAGTSLFAGLGLARRHLGPGLRGGRLALGVAVALALTGTIATLFAAAAIGNDLALRGRPAATSRFGPTDPSLPLPDCDDPLVVPSSAIVRITLDGDVDGRSLGGLTIDGERNGGNARADLTVATTLELGRRGAARVGGSAWLLRDGAWQQSAPASADVARDLALDDVVVREALGSADRSAAEARGEEYVEGARARRCRLAVDGTTFLRAFPSAALIVGPTDLHRWRGQVDYWIFADGAVGRLTGSVNGDAATLPADGILGTVRVTLTSVDRGQPVRVERPAP